MDEEYPMFQRRPFLAALLLVAGLWATGFVALIFRTSERQMKAEQERQSRATIPGILEMGQLAGLPESAKDVKAVKSDVWMGYSSRLEFNASLSDIRQWIDKSQGVTPAGHFDAANAGSRHLKYNLPLKKPGRGHTGTIELDEATGRVKIEIEIIDSSL